jgi:hypothetical protein
MKFVQCCAPVLAFVSTLLLHAIIHHCQISTKRSIPFRPSVPLSFHPAQNQTNDCSSGIHFIFHSCDSCLHICTLVMIAPQNSKGQRKTLNTREPEQSASPNHYFVYVCVRVQVCKLKWCTKRKRAKSEPADSALFSSDVLE